MNEESQNDQLPVARLVAVGMSAGGSTSLTKLLDSLPDVLEYAVVIVGHMDSEGHDALMDVAKAHARRPVRVIHQGQRIEHNCLYVPPPQTFLCALDGHFRLARKAPDAHGPIDNFLNSVGQDPDLQALAIILAGTGRDGTEGIGAIKAKGGHVIVEDPSNATEPQMPASAIATGFVDVVTTPDAMGPEIERLLFAESVTQDVASPYDVSAEAMSTALALLQKNAGLNVAYYKDVNLRRRLLRRVLLRQGQSVDEYVGLLQEDPQEAASLRDDLLIGVTSFFRNAELVDALKQHVIPALFDAAPDGIRIWVPACSTGEEAYTIAMVVLGAMAEQGISVPLQIFGTDVNQRAISLARNARYSASAIEAVPEEYRESSFVQEGDSFVVTKEIRSVCIFAQHNVLTNAPFSNLDLVSCRNLFIYLRKEAQQQALEVFSYALKPDGFLLLGRSESAASAGLFNEVGKGLNLYSKRILPRRAQRTMAFHERTQWGTTDPEAGAPPPVPSSRQLEEAANRVALAHFIPAGFLVNETGEILQFRGDTSPYLQPVSGDATLGLTRLLRPELHLDARGALVEAVRTRATARRDRVLIDQQLHVLEVLPVPYGGRLGQYYLITIHVQGTLPTAQETADHTVLSSRQEDLERHILVLTEELEQTRSQLKSIISEYEATNEELRTSNEEVLSSNEELQSTNEELKTAKDELETTNAELEFVNLQLEERNGQLVLANDDLTNLIEGIPVPVLLLDRELNVRHFSPQAALLFRLDEGNIGQPLTKSRMRFDGDVISRMLRDVISDLVPVEEEIADSDGRWFLTQARAYRTTDHRIEGAVVTFQDIHRLKRALADSESARAEAEKASSAKNDFLALVSHELRSPLNAISGWASVLSRVAASKVVDDIVLKGIETIERSCRVQAQLIDDLLDMARISSGRLALDIRPVDLSATVRSVVEGLRPNAQAQGIALHTDRVDDAIIVQGDARRLQQVATNLLQNAIKFTPRGGRVEVRLERLNGLAELSVIDNGVGISDELLPRIFERFSQTDFSKTRQYGGLGLGLSIVKHLVDGHGGTVLARSDGPDNGARFHVRLPLPVNEISVTELPVVQPVAPDMLPGIRVLVVDDEEEGRTALCELLRLAGAEPTPAASATQALDLLQDKRFHAVVSDIAMPGTHGQELARMIRKRERAGEMPRVHLVALTGFTSVAERDEALASGFDDHVGKPLDAGAFVRRLTAALRNGMQVDIGAMDSL